MKNLGVIAAAAAIILASMTAGAVPVKVAVGPAAIVQQMKMKKHLMTMKRKQRSTIKHVKMG